MIKASAASASLWLVIPDGKCFLSPALFRASASMVPLTFVPLGHLCFSDSTSEYAKLMYASPRDANLWSVSISSKLREGFINVVALGWFFKGNASCQVFFVTFITSFFSYLVRD